LNQPVDPKALRIADYLGMIKRPMDVRTVTHRLKECLYSFMRGLLLDVELLMANATRSTFAVHLATSLRSVYER
jgi:hypothetical protein